MPPGKTTVLLLHGLRWSFDRHESRQCQTGWTGPIGLNRKLHDLNDSDCPDIERAVQRCRQGDIDGLEILYRKYRDWVFRLCCRMARDEAEAADWTQEVFVRVFRRLNGYDGRANFSTWIYRVALNFCLDQLKRPERRGSRLEDADHRIASENPEDAAFSKERTESVWKAMDKLTPKLRSVLVLKDLEGLSYSEISRILEIPEGTVGSRLNQARKELARALEPFFKQKAR